MGDSVYLSTRNLSTLGGKLTAKWAGPYVVTEVKKNGVSVRLDLRGELGKTNPVFHVSQPKPYEVSELQWPGRENQHRPAPELVDGETEWQVERVVDKKVTTERRRVTRTETPPVRASGERALRQRAPREVTQMEDVPVVWYKLRWQGYDEETWQRQSDCHCPELIAEYELLQRQRDEQTAVDSGEQAATVTELAEATAVSWWLTDKQRPVGVVDRLCAARTRPPSCWGVSHSCESDCSSVRLCALSCVGLCVSTCGTERGCV